MVSLPIRCPLFRSLNTTPIPSGPSVPSVPSRQEQANFSHYNKHRIKIQFSLANRSKPIQSIISSKWNHNKPPIMQPVNEIHTNPYQKFPTYYKEQASSERPILSCISSLIIQVLLHISCWFPLIWFSTLPSLICRQIFSLLVWLCTLLLLLFIGLRYPHRQGQIFNFLVASLMGESFEVMRKCLMDPQRHRICWFWFNFYGWFLSVSDFASSMLIILR